MHENTLPQTLPEVPINSSESPPFKRTSLIYEEMKEDTVYMYIFSYRLQTVTPFMGQCENEIELAVAHTQAC